MAGQHISMGGGDSWLAHSDAIDSTTMVTDETGAVVWDQVFGPWGEIWQQTGTRPWFVFAGLRWPVNDPLHPSATREFSSNVFRWMTPDPGGRNVVKLDNPQTWNMYAYVTNNPTSLNDPSGLCTGGPAGWATAGYCGLQIDPWGNGAGAVVGGYDVFDAMEAAPGTTPTLDLSAHTGFGFTFSENQWVNYWANSEMQFENSAAYHQAVSGQYQTVSTDLAKVFPTASVTSEVPKYVQGGHAAFWINCDNVTGGCAGRWPGGLHIETNGHGKYWGHNDRASPYIGSGFNWRTVNLWNLVVHGTVDVINGHLGNYIFPY